ncbi:hypothetical protein N7532_004600 [Penicillium argentinense]|uniref:Uncharacterized protein n=1 Tax=Penicillium argentinense TaxID=1131581 RepID=A0A9W9KFP6_9EURO|nr:uncharacterized protein N7532_004600 [Penicillium argentinense]KAJ5104071.1 hypothetical protein N7532_004600 [Penicillium argentinense]
MAEKSPKYRQEIHIGCEANTTHGQLEVMFVSGDESDPSDNTTDLIEELIRQQVMEMVDTVPPPLTIYLDFLTSIQRARGTSLAARRGSRSISADDLLFLIRHNKTKTARLQRVRRSAKDSEDQTLPDEEDFGLIDDTQAGTETSAPVDPVVNSQGKKRNPEYIGILAAYIRLIFWGPKALKKRSGMSKTRQFSAACCCGRTHQEISMEEYLLWSEYRHASFTFRRAKRFRARAAIDTLIDAKPEDDVIDVLGFLGFDVVQTLTEEALEVKEKEGQFDADNRIKAICDAAGSYIHDGGPFSAKKVCRKRALTPKYIREAFRRLQATPRRSVALLLKDGRIPPNLPVTLA